MIMIHFRCTLKITIFNFFGHKNAFYILQLLFLGFRSQKNFFYPVIGIFEIIFIYNSSIQLKIHNHSTLLLCFKETIICRTQGAIPNHYPEMRQVMRSQKKNKMAFIIFGKTNFHSSIRIGTRWPAIVYPFKFLHWCLKNG